MCGPLGVTKGSFHWHFDGIPSYRTALIEAWGELRDEDRRHIDEMGDVPPRERLSKDDDLAGQPAALDAGARPFGTSLLTIRVDLTD